MTRISKAKFYAYLIKNDCIYAKTAEAIRKAENVTMSRQAVQARATKDPEKLKEIQEYLKDKAESNILDLMDNSQSDSVKLKANMFFLERKAKDRGYGQELEIKKEIIKKKKIDLSDVDPEMLLKIKNAGKGNEYSDNSDESK